MTTPKLKISHLKSYGLYYKISGATQPGVPHVMYFGCKFIN